MFTGIVQGIRKITAVEDLEGRRRLRIQLEELAEKLQQGASVAVNGVCLTVVRFEGDWAEFDIIRESRGFVFEHWRQQVALHVMNAYRWNLPGPGQGASK